MLGEQAILNRIRKIEKLNDEISERKEAVDKIKDELRKHLVDINETSCSVGHYTIWNEVTERHNLDNSRMKNAYETLCNEYGIAKEDFTKTSFVTTFRITHKQY